MNKMKTVKINNNEYVMVNERIKFFRENYHDWSLESEILKADDDVCMIKAVIKDDKGAIRATGHAYEKAGSNFINKTSYIENCETSAWGRALANLGIGIDASVASAEEVGNAILNQNQASAPVLSVDDWIIKINQATAVNQLNAMYYKWREQFAEGSEEFKRINKASGDRKLALQNPDLIVGVRS